MSAPCAGNCYKLGGREGAALARWQCTYGARCGNPGRVKSCVPRIPSLKAPTGGPFHSNLSPLIQTDGRAWARRCVDETITGSAPIPANASRTQREADLNVSPSSRRWAWA
ncbi:hypothetical protein MRX96_036438 [Rhipicephalus microplus]